MIHNRENFRNMYVNIFFQDLLDMPYNQRCVSDQYHLNSKKNKCNPNLRNKQAIYETNQASKGLKVHSSIKETKINLTLK